MDTIEFVRQVTLKENLLKFCFCYFKPNPPRGSKPGWYGEAGFLSTETSLYSLNSLVFTYHFMLRLDAC